MLSLYYALQFIRENISKPRNLFKLILFGYFWLKRENPIISPLELNGYKITLDPNSHADRNIFFHDFVDEDLTNFLQKNVKKNTVFFDIGANSGYFSLLVSSLSSKTFVHAFEPVHGVYRNLKKSIRLNGIKNIKANQVCVSNKSGKGVFYVDSHSDLSSIKKTGYQKEAKTISTEMITLNDYCLKNKITKLHIIKIDTEGSEKDILFSSQKILKKFKPVLIIEFSNETAKAFSFHPNEIYDHLINNNYKIYSYHHGRLRLQKKKQSYNENLYCFYGDKHTRFV